MENKPYQLINGDCLEEMRSIADASVDAVICDPPFGTTACAWDSIIPFDAMWKELKRICKANAAICLFGQDPFSSLLNTSNLSMYRYKWIWKKNRTTGHANANKMPMKNAEEISVFYSALPTYNPQGLEDCLINQKRKNKLYAGLRGLKEQGGMQLKTNYPKTVLEGFSAEFQTVHPTQKPVELLRYLIRTYTQDGETVLDFTCGSGSTGVAALMENRKFIGIEKDANYFEIAKSRIEAALTKEPLFATA